MAIFNNLCEMIGNSSLVRLDRSGAGLPGNIIGKLLINLGVELAPTDGHFGIPSDIKEDELRRCKTTL